MSVASVARRAETAVELPRLLVAAAQPYATLAGPALTLHFLHHPQLLPFQRRHFAHAAVAPVYSHVLLQSLAEFATTPRRVRDSDVKMLRAPLPAFWSSLGVINCFYATAYPTRRDGSNSNSRSGKGNNNSTASSSAATAASADEHALQCATHPAMGAVELVRSSHRRECDVKMTLYDDAHTPLYTMLMTGPHMTSRYEHTSSSGRQQRQQSGNDGGGGGDDDAALVRTPLPYIAPPPLSSTSSSLESVSEHDVGDGAAPIVGGLYGELLRLRGGGYAQRACYWRRVRDAAAATAVIARDDEAALPPWVLHSCVQDMCAALSAAGALRSRARGDDGEKRQMDGVAGGSAAAAATAGAAAGGSGGVWELVAHQTVHCGDARLGQALDVVCAPPRVVTRYRLPPWRLSVGLPALRGDTACVLLRAEVRQHGRVVLTGTFYLTHASLC